MKMHNLRVWQRTDITICLALVVCSVILSFIGLIGTAVGMWLLSLIVPIVGTLFRKHILASRYRYAKSLGLKRIFLLVCEETAREVWYELHIMIPDSPMHTTSLLREFLNDIETLYAYGKTHEKDVVFVGTSHRVWTQAAIAKANRLGLECVELGELLDKTAPLSQREWRRVLRDFQGKDPPYSNAPSTIEWRTFLCRIPNQEERREKI